MHNRIGKSALDPIENSASQTNLITKSSSLPYIKK